MRRVLTLAAAALAAVMLTAASDDVSEHIKDPKLEARAENLFSQFRCVVCQNESIAASEADIAHDMRKLVRAQVAAGKSDKDVRAYMFARYGDFILLRPRLTPATAILWGGPFAIVLGGLILLLMRRRRESAPEVELSKAELAKLKALETETKEALES